MPEHCSSETIGHTRARRRRMTASELLVVQPDGAPRGGVVVLQEAFGITPHIEDIAQRLAAEGWLAVAPHLFHRGGSPVFSYDVDHSEIMPFAAALTVESVLEDVDSAIAEMRSHGVADDRVGAVGFCMGGSAALLAAAKRPIAAAVTFYGTGIVDGAFGGPPLTELVQEVQGAWLGLYGDRDEYIPAQEVDALERAAAHASGSVEIHRYADAGHGFNCDARSSFNPDAAADAWKRTLVFLESNVGTA
jgi:carboxymethylenebutenolidase